MAERIIGNRKDSHLIYSDSSTPDHAWLNRLFVPRNQRGSGEGSRLLEEFFAIAKAQGITDVTTLIYPDQGENRDAVIKFAEKHGFVAKNPYIPTYIYSKKL